MQWSRVATVLIPRLRAKAISFCRSPAWERIRIWRWRRPSLWAAFSASLMGGQPERSGFTYRSQGWRGFLIDSRFSRGLPRARYLGNCSLASGGRPFAARRAFLSAYQVASLSSFSGATVAAPRYGENCFQYIRNRQVGLPVRFPYGSSSRCPLLLRLGPYYVVCGGCLRLKYCGYYMGRLFLLHPTGGEIRCAYIALVLLGKSTQKGDVSKHLN